MFPPNILNEIHQMITEYKNKTYTNADFEHFVKNCFGDVAVSSNGVYISQKIKNYYKVFLFFTKNKVYLVDYQHFQEYWTQSEMAMKLRLDEHYFIGDTTFTPNRVRQYFLIYEHFGVY